MRLIYEYHQSSGCGFLCLPSMNFLLIFRVVDDLWRLNCSLILDLYVIQTLAFILSEACFSEIMLSNKLLSQQLLLVQSGCSNDPNTLLFETNFTCGIMRLLTDVIIVVFVFLFLATVSPSEYNFIRFNFLFCLLSPSLVSVTLPIVSLLLSKFDSFFPFDHQSCNPKITFS